MKREIKFRGYNKATGKWLYGGLMIFEDGTITMAESETVDGKIITSPVDAESIGEYIGYSHTRNCDIYEGDIIPVPVGVQSSGSIKYGGEELMNGSVGYNPHQCRWDIQFKEGNRHNLISCEFGWGGQSHTVIGNVYQHPELL